MDRSAFDLAETVRYSGDLKYDSVASSRGVERLRNIFRHSGLLVSPQITPGIYSALSDALQNLGILELTPDAFVYSSPEVNASCFLGDEADFIISMSSSLVTLMKQDELSFVIGHELGHFLLNHSEEILEKDELRTLRVKRAREISADRIGMIACGSLETAVRAMMKTVSGLPSELIRFDISYFASQAAALKEDKFNDYAASATHPSILIRTRALINFANYFNGDRFEFLARKEQLDKMIEADFRKHIDGCIVRALELQDRENEFWRFAAACLENGKFSKGDQDKVKSEFGDGMLEKLLNLLRDRPVNEVREIVSQNLHRFT